MASTIATLRVLLTGDDAELRKKLKSSDKKTRDWAKNQIKHTQRVRQAFKVGAAAVLATGAAYGALTQKAVAAADKLAKTADKIGLTVEGLQELRFAAERAGVSQKTLDMSMQRFTRRLGEAQQGTGVLGKELQRLGINVRNSDGSLKTSEQVLGEYADAIGNAGTSQERLRLAFAAFDSEGAALANMFKNGKAGMDEMRQAAQDLGIIMSDSTARKAEQLSDQFGTLGTVLSNKVNTALIESAHSSWPAMVQAMDIAEVAFYRIKQGMHLAVAGIHVLRSGLAQGYAAFFRFSRGIIDSISKAVDITGVQMKILAQRVRLGVLNAVNAAAEAGDAALSKAPDFVKAFFGYTDGDFSSGTNAMVSNARVAIAELEGELAGIRNREDSKPSLVEQALLGVAGQADAAVEAAVAKAFEAQQRIDEIKAGGGIASTVSDTLGFGGDPAATGGGTDTAAGDALGAANEKITMQQVQQMENEQKLVNTRRNTMKMTLGFLQQQVKGGSAAAKAIMAGMTALNIAQIISNTEVAKMRAMAELGPAAGPPMAAAIQTQGMVAMGIAAAQGIQGMFHDGIDNVPNTGTYLLEKGERVVDRRLNEDLTKALSEGGGVGGGGNTLNINVSGVTDAETINRVISEQRPQFEQMLMDINSDRAGQGLI